MKSLNSILPSKSALQRLNPKDRSRAVWAVLVILSLHLLVFGGLLIQGCRQDERRSDSANAELTNQVTWLTTNQPSIPATNVPLAAQPLTETNALTSPAPSVTETIPAAPQEVPIPNEPAKEYTVAKGDSFWKIAMAHHVSMKVLVEANPGIDPTKLKVGQGLEVPVATKAPTATAGLESPPAQMSYTNYVVKHGDTLSKIATAHGTTVMEIRTVNNLKSNRIVAGQTLKLPKPKTAHAAASSVQAQLP